MVFIEGENYACLGITKTTEDARKVLLYDSLTQDSRIVTSGNGLYKISEIQKKARSQSTQYYYILSEKPELKKIYKEEIENFNKKISEGERTNMNYFLPTSLSSADGLGELLAEVNALCTFNAEVDKTRALYLMRYFPRTIATAAELLGYGVSTK